MKPVIDPAQLKQTLSQSTATLKYLNVLPAKIEPAMKAGSDVVYREVRKLLSGRGRSLDELAARGHPYAARHGIIQTAATGFSNPNAIATRSGRALRSLRQRKRGIYYEVYFATETAPYLRAILKGSSSLLPRDPIGSVVSLPATRAEVMRVIAREAKKLL